MRVKGRWVLVGLLGFAAVGGAVWWWRGRDSVRPASAPEAPPPAAPAAPAVPADHARNLQALRTQLAAVPQDARLHHLLALEYARAADWGPALAAAEQAVALAPQDATSHQVMGFVTAQAGMGDRAVSAYQRAIRLAPDEVRLLVEAGIYFSQVGLPHLAEPPLRRALEVEPDHHIARLALAAVVLARGLPDEYAAMVRAVFDARPDDPVVQYHLANNLLGMHDLQRASEVIEALLPVASNDSAVLLLAGRVRLRQGPSADELPQVRALFERAATHPATAAEANYYLGICHLQAGDFPAARVAFEAAVEQAPNYRLAYQQLIQVYSRLGEPTPLSYAQRKYTELTAQHERAGELRRQAARAPHDPQALLEAGRLATDEGRIAEAQALLAQALALAPTSREIRGALAAAYRFAGRTRDADALLAAP